jgi:hypothetical protein
MKSVQVLAIAWLLSSPSHAAGRWVAQGVPCPVLAERAAIPGNLLAGRFWR